MTFPGRMTFCSNHKFLHIDDIIDRTKLAQNLLDSSPRPLSIGFGAELPRSVLRKIGALEVLGVWLFCRRLVIILGAH